MSDALGTCKVDSPAVGLGQTCGSLSYMRENVKCEEGLVCVRKEEVQVRQGGFVGNQRVRRRPFNFEGSVNMGDESSGLNGGASAEVYGYCMPLASWS
jgi:hypothetical protein